MARRKRRRKKRNIKYFRIFIVFIVFLVLIFLFLNSRLFSVNKIVVEGNEKFEKEDLIEESNIELGDNFFFFNKKKSENNLLENPFIEDVEISRAFPKTIKIHVKEREGYATIQVGNNYIVIDPYGYFIEKSKALLLNLKVIRGLENTENIKLGETIFQYATEDQNKLLSKIFDGTESVPFKSLTLEEDRCEMTIPGDVYVGFGSYNDAEYKLEILNQMIGTIESDTRNASMILMEEVPHPMIVFE